MKYEVAAFELAIVKDLCLTISSRTSGVLPSRIHRQKEKRKTTFVIGMKVLSVF